MEAVQAMAEGWIGRERGPNPHPLSLSPPRKNIEKIGKNSPSFLCAQQATVLGEAALSGDRARQGQKIPLLSYADDPGDDTKQMPVGGVGVRANGPPTPWTAFFFFFVFFPVLISVLVIFFFFLFFLNSFTGFFSCISFLKAFFTTFRPWELKKVIKVIKIICFVRQGSEWPRVFVCDMLPCDFCRPVVVTPLPLTAFFVAQQHPNNLSLLNFLLFFPSFFQKLN